MARSDERSLSDLKQGAERTRAEFTDTVDQLRSKVSETVSDFRERVSPDAIKAEVGDYFRTRGDLLLDKARENPLQAAAIGAGLAYPLLGIVRSIPAPVLMIGAGLFLLGTSSGQKVSRKFGVIATDLSDQIVDRADAVRRNIHDAQDAASDGIASVKSTVSSGLGSLKQQTSATSATLSEGTGQLRENAASLAGFVSDRIDDLKQKAGASIGTSSDAVRQGATAAGAMVQNAAETATDFGTDTAVNLRDRAVETSQKATTILSATIQQNPLLVVGIGLAIGMLIASALPRSDVERGLMGDVSADVQKRASDMASQGFDAAKDMASAIVSDVAHRAEKEGLTPAGLQEATEDFGRRVRKVAENATTTAFDLPLEETTDQRERRSGP
jgi:ElaB/YqjD/DUF883 family membrane-anchored ribosome-binding protein